MHASCGRYPRGAEYRAAHPDDRRALFHRHLEVVAHAHRQLAQAGGRRPRRPPAGRAAHAAGGTTAAPASGSSTAGGSSISPTSSAARARLGRRHRSPAPRPAPPRTWWPRRPGPPESAPAAPPAPAAAASIFCNSATPSSAWIQSKRLGGLPRLVRLQVADEVPPDRSVGHHADLLQPFLHLVLAEIALAGSHRRRHVPGPVGLRHRHEPHGRRVAPRSGRRSRDTCPDIRQPPAIELVELAHAPGGFSWASIVLACRRTGRSAPSSGTARTRPPHRAPCPR